MLFMSNLGPSIKDVHRNYVVFTPFLVPTYGIPTPQLRSCKPVLHIKYHVNQVNSYCQLLSISGLEASVRRPRSFKPSLPLVHFCLYLTLSLPLFADILYGWALLHRLYLWKQMPRWLLVFVWVWTPYVGKVINGYICCPEIASCFGVNCKIPPSCHCAACVLCFIYVDVVIFVLFVAVTGLNLACFWCCICCWT